MRSERNPAFSTRTSQWLVTPREVTMNDRDETKELSNPGDLQERARSLDEPITSVRSPVTFRMLIESLKDFAIFMLDPAGVVSTWNDGAKRLEGYTAMEIIGKHFSEFYPSEDVASGKCEWELEMAARDGRFEDEGWRLRKDGSRFWANVIITALHDESGALVGYAKVIRDLTERRKAEQERLRAQQERFELEKMHEASRMKDHFLATISHELRTPLNAIVGWAELMKSGDDPTATEKGLDTILRNAKAQITIVDDMLDVSRIVTGKMRLELGSVDLAAIVRDAMEVVRPAADAREVRLEMASPDAPALLVGDAVRLQQMAWNFLSNAVKFSHAGGAVSVSLRRDDSSMLFSVADGGRGIDPEFLPHVFEPFRQADVGTTRRVGGVGLGLAIVKYIVELHGGQVFAESEGYGKGATFTAKIPIRAAVSVQSTAPKGTETSPVPARREPGKSLDGIRVLVVDDEADARELLQVLFRVRGATVQSAASAEEARGAVASFGPDIILCDIGMPREDGYQFLRSIRELPEEQGGRIPAIALTAYAYERDMQRALDAGFDCHLAKPANHVDLVRVIHDLLRSSGTRAVSR
ncbi:ATP-binding protein [Pendulispora rubella]|uniref:histidine kinase n=1 Tax=Pendulispora rubella TaxID=2741070 RepID=A0ABZ2LFS5_9BACT